MSYYKFAFSQKHGYLVARQETSVAAGGKTLCCRVRSPRVLGPGSGLAFPKLIRTTSSRRPNSLYLTEVKQVVANQPIGEDELTLEFPREQSFRTTAADSFTFGKAARAHIRGGERI